MFDASAHGFRCRTLAWIFHPPGPASSLCRSMRVGRWWSLVTVDSAVCRPRVPHRSGKDLAQLRRSNADDSKAGGLKAITPCRVQLPPWLTDMKYKAGCWRERSRLHLDTVHVSPARRLTDRVDRWRVVVVVAVIQSTPMTSDLPITVTCFHFADRVTWPVSRSGSVMVAVRMCVDVVAAALTVVPRSQSDGRLPRSDRSRPTVKYYVHVNVTDVPASTLHLRK